MGRFIRRNGVLIMKKVKLKIPFENIKDAIDMASYEHHYFIDKKNHSIVFISEIEEDYEEKLEECENDNFISFEPRTPQENFSVMEQFVYNIKDFNIAQKFMAVLSKKKPFSNFKELLYQFPKLREEWFKFKDKQLENDTMDWLCNNEIELEDMSFMPKIEVKELKPEEVKFPPEFRGFGPIECMKCKNKDGIKTRYFELSHLSENILIDKEIKRIMKENFKIENYGCLSGGEKEILTASWCDKCKSNELFEDF